MLLSTDQSVDVLWWCSFIWSTLVVFFSQTKWQSISICYVFSWKNRFCCYLNGSLAITMYGSWFTHRKSQLFIQIRDSYYFSCQCRQGPVFCFSRASGDFLLLLWLPWYSWFPILQQISCDGSSGSRSWYPICITKTSELWSFFGTHKQPHSWCRFDISDYLQSCIPVWHFWFL